jgi:hypothetical protein
MTNFIKNLFICRGRIPGNRDLDGRFLTVVNMAIALIESWRAPPRWDNFCGAGAVVDLGLDSGGQECPPYA